MVDPHPKLRLQDLTCRFDDSGKSTLLRCLNLLEPIDSGHIWLDGEDISVPGLDPKPYRKRIGIVFQSFNLFPHMTVMQNITLAPRRVLGTSVTDTEQHALELLEESRHCPCTRYATGDYATRRNYLGT